MAATRKLQAEIDRCLKKVAEGVEKFEETWQKFHNASNANQKEKYEDDLKKEIKKLQRLRDQIKTWIASAEIKDKSILMDKRRLIEQQMERFKVVERETKTKAYSKEGLTSGTKLDPAERERYEISQWLNNCLESLNIQIDQFEAEIEALQTAKKKKNKNENSDKIEEYNQLLEKHRDHVQKLETILRMLDNKTVEINQIRNIKDDVEYYIENCLEPDFTENDLIYDEIDGLEEMLLDIGLADHKENSLENVSETLSSTSASSPVSFGHQLSMDSTSTTDITETDKRRHKSLSDDIKGGSQASSTKASGPASTSGTKTVSSSSSLSSASSSSASATALPQLTPEPSKLDVVTNGAASSSQNNHLPVWSQVAVSNTTTSSNQHFPSQQQQSSSNSSGKSQHQSIARNGSSTVRSSKAPPASGPGSGANHVNSNGTLSQTLPNLQQHQQHNFASAVVNGHPPSDLSQVGSTTPAPSIGYASVAASTPVGANSISQSTGQDSSLPSLKAIAQRVTDQAGLNMSDSQAELGAAANFSHQGLFQGTRVKEQSRKAEVTIPPLLGVAPLGPVPVTKETQLQYQLLEAASMHMPHPLDSERLRPYLPRNPCTTPPYYPQLPPVGSDTIEFFQRLSTETLFFIFYYMEGTKAQYLAAKALKKLSWRFHTRYMMWFQRHEEPKIINDEFEQGTYIYFDFEKWGQRKKEGFTFEYRFLEDRELN